MSPQVCEMIKVFDEDVFGKLFIIDYQDGLPGEEPAPDLLVLELLLPEESVRVDEVVLPHQGGLGVRAAEGEGGLCVGDAPLLELVKVLGDIPVNVKEDQGYPKKNL